MKKILVLLALAVTLAGCYDPFRLDHTFSSVAFSKADGASNVEGVLHRTAVKDEGLHLDIGINLTGVLENDVERWAEFVIDPELIDTNMQNLGYQLMPEEYYSLSNESRFIIEPGSILGKVTVTLDSLAFLSDPNAVNHVYTLPIALTETSEDSINESLSTKLIVLKYINHYEGAYEQDGIINSYDAGGALVDTDTAFTVINMTTVRLDSVVTDGMLNQIGSEFEMTIHVNADNSVFINNTDASLNNAIETTGACTYDPEASIFTLNYKVTSTDGSYKTAVVSLKWRNRIRDGINEWRRN